MAMTRRQIREHVFKLLFDLDFYESGDFGEQIDLYFRQAAGEEDAQGAPSAAWPDEKDEPLPLNAEEKDREDICSKTLAVVEKIPEIDEASGKVAKGWKTKRMAKADLSLLRLAVYEIMYDDSVPAGVAINEAVELAKIYGSDSTPAFVNGILATFAR